MRACLPVIASGLVVLALGAASCADSDAPGGATAVSGPTVAAPEWPAGATVSVSSVGPRHAALSWPQATSDVGAVRYHVLVDGVPTRTVDGTATVLTGLAPASAHSVTVRAEDPNAAASTDGPSASFETRSSWSSVPPPTPRLR